MGKDNFTLIPNGAAGIEDRLQLLYTFGVCEGKFDLNRMVALGSTHPASIFGLYPRKGTIAVGSDADLVLYDPTATGTRSVKTHHSRCDRSLFEGFRVKGKPTCVIANGRVQFVTVYPGWYQGRAVHVHFKIRSSAAAGARSFTSQLFFDDALTDRVHAQAPYASKGQGRLRNSGDDIFRSSNDKLTLAVTQDGSGYASTFDIGVQLA